MNKEGRHDIAELMGAGFHPTASGALRHQETAREGQHRKRQGPMPGPICYGGEGIL